MSRSFAILTAYCWFNLGAGTAAGAEPSAESRAGTETARPLKEVTIDPTAKPPVCRRHVPTGSRIATKRCQSADADRATSNAERYQMQRDMDEMRMRQAARARAAAQAEALRQRAGF